ncbi:MAG: hypothetical protein QMD12_02560 [Candidatus Aenigmarchaeota archaeon]|nr:hypothetical protein [Candidatus Aenigmarchaeota archaeon]
MKKVALLLLFLLFIFFVSLSSEKKFNRKPVVVWYIVAKYVEDDFFEMVEKYKPDIILLSVFAEDDILPLNGSKDFDLKAFVEKSHALGVRVFYSYSIFSRSMYEYIKNTSLPLEQYLHVSAYAKYLRENDEKAYHELFDYYLENGLNPEDIPRVKRKPVGGFYVEIGHYSMINPLYKPYRDFIAKVINETIQVAKPDGLAFDHIRFFTFDAGYDEDIREYVLGNFGLDIYNYTPKPPFLLDKEGWSKEDRIYYDARAKLIEYAVSDIINRFSGYKKFGTTIGVIDPARANGQYVELQANVFDGLLLMAYDDDPKEVARNVRETVLKAGNKEVILGISVTVDDPIENIKDGLENGASGIYLLGYSFNEDVHNYLLEVRV